MGQSIGLDPDGIGLADELGVGEHGAVNEADIGKPRLDLLGPGVVNAEDHDPGLCGVGEFDFAGGVLRCILLAVKYKASQIGQLLAVGLGGDTVRYAAPSEIKKQLDMASKEIARIKPTADKKDIVFKIVRITAAIWQTHPFREGNTRSVVAFSVLLASKLGVKLDYELFASHAAYVRNALVWCTQGIYSTYDYLERIYFDAAGLLDDQPEQTAAKQKDYSMIEGYKVADYKEQPHTYLED